MRNLCSVISSISRRIFRTLGTKRHVLTDGQGIPLCVVVTAATTHDMKAAIHTLDNIVVKGPSSKMSKKKLARDLTG
ncbi:MAG: transposase [Nitrososphaeraceae archaeon]